MGVKVKVEKKEPYSLDITVEDDGSGGKYVYYNFNKDNFSFYQCINIKITGYVLDPNNGQWKTYPVEDKFGCGDLYAYEKRFKGAGYGPNLKVELVYEIKFNNNQTIKKSLSFSTDMLKN